LLWRASASSKALACLEKSQPHLNYVEQPNAWAAADVGHDVQQTQREGDADVHARCCGVPSSCKACLLQRQTQDYHSAQTSQLKRAGRADGGGRR